MGICQSSKFSPGQKEVQKFIKECFPEQFQKHYNNMIITLNIHSLEELNAQIHAQEFFPIKFSDQQIQLLQNKVENRNTLITQSNQPRPESKKIQDNIYDFPNSYKKDQKHDEIKQIIFFGMDDIEKESLLKHLINSYLGVQFYDSFRYVMTPVQHNQLKIYQINQEILFIDVVGFTNKNFRENREILLSIYDSLIELKFNPDLIFFINSSNEQQLSYDNIQLVYGIFELFQNNFDSISRLRVILTNYDSGDLILTAYQKEESIFRQLTYLIENGPLYFGVNTNFSQDLLQFRENNYKTIDILSKYIKEYPKNQDTITILSDNFQQKQQDFFKIIELKEKLKVQQRLLKIHQFNFEQVQGIYQKYKNLSSEDDLENLEFEQIYHMDDNEESERQFIKDILNTILNQKLSEEEQQAVILNSVTLLQSLAGTQQFKESQELKIKELLELKLRLNNYNNFLKTQISDKIQTQNLGKLKLLKRIIKYQASTPWPRYGLSMEEIEDYITNRNDDEARKWLYF